MSGGACSGSLTSSRRTGRRSSRPVPGWYNSVKEREMETVWDILSMGECMVEFFPDPPGAETYRRSFGGDTFNTIAMATKLGSRCAYLTRIADDFFGEFLRRSLSGVGVDLTPTVFCSGYNGIYFIAVDQSGERRFQYFRTGSAASHLSARDVESRWIAQTRLFFTSGITQAISSTAADAVQQACSLAHARGKLVAFDVNFRPRLWTAEQAARHLRAIASWIQILFLSATDIPVVQTALQVRSDTVEALLDACWQQGISRVVIKQGEKGVLLGEAATGQITAVRPFTGKVVDTSGAGDTFNGAFLHSFLQGKSAIECARWGVAAAALKVGRPGTVSAMPTAQEVEAVVDRVVVEE
ncbi:MAG: sugar kinase [Nitrospinota bacterium]|nr:MAG: sugar kinase [Nitrospinota bacterium]